MSAWNDAHCASTLRVARALRLEFKKSDVDASSILVAAQRRVAATLLSARAMSHLALGRVWLAMLDAEAGVDCAPELAVAHLRLGEVYEAAAGSKEQSLRSLQRASALEPTNQSISQRLERARNAPATPLTSVASGSRAYDGGGTGTENSGASRAASGEGSMFDMSLDQVDKEWEATGLQRIRNAEWHELRRKACPHGVILAVTDNVEKNLAAAAAVDSEAHNYISAEEYIEKEHFAERAMTLYARKRSDGGHMPEVGRGLVFCVSSRGSVSSFHCSISCARW